MMPDEQLEIPLHEQDLVVQERVLARQEESLLSVNPQVAMIQMIERAARDPLVNVDKLERLFELQERTAAQGRKERFQEALRLCQMEMPRVEKNGLVSTKEGRQIYSYAKLEDLDACIRPIYQKHGFTVSYNAPMAVDGGKIRNVANFSCAGHTECPEITAAPSNRSAGNITLTDAQKVKQTITECRRHLLEMFFNIITIGAEEQKDDPITENQAHDLQSAFEEVGGNKAAFLKMLDAESFSAVAASKLDFAYKQLELKRQKGRA